MINGQPVAVGRLTTEGAVPTRARQVQEPEADETDEADAPNAFDLNSLTPEQRVVYEKGKRLNAMIAAIEAKYPEGDPLDRMEMVLDAVLPMDETQLMNLMIASSQTYAL